MGLHTHPAYGVGSLQSQSHFVDRYCDPDDYQIDDEKLQQIANHTVLNKIQFLSASRRAHGRPTL